LIALIDLDSSGTWKTRFYFGMYFLPPISRSLFSQEQIRLWQLAPWKIVDAKLCRSHVHGGAENWGVMTEIQFIVYKYSTVTRSASLHWFWIAYGRKEERYEIFLKASQSF